MHSVGSAKLAIVSSETPIGRPAYETTMLAKYNIIKVAFILFNNTYAKQIG